MTKQRKRNRKIYRGGEKMTVDQLSQNEINKAISQKNQNNTSNMFSIQSVPNVSTLREDGLSQQANEAQKTVDMTNLTMKGGNPSAKNGAQEVSISDFATGNNVEEAQMAVSNAEAALEADAHSRQASGVNTRIVDGEVKDGSINSPAPALGGGRRRRRKVRRRKVRRRNSRRRICC